MNDEFWNTVRGVVANMVAQMSANRMGTVVSVDPATATARVQYDEEGTLSGPLPIMQQAAGNGWGMVTLPTPGTQVFIGSDMGDVSHGVIMGAVHSRLQPPGKVRPYGDGSSPIPLVPGEPTLIHTSGASLRLIAGGVEINGNLFVRGDLMVHGDISDDNGVHNTLDYLRICHNIHVHSDPQGGNVSVPDRRTP